MINFWGDPQFDIDELEYEETQEDYEARIEAEKVDYLISQMEG